jgi:hypothetical protein
MPTNRAWLASRAPFFSFPTLSFDVIMLWGFRGVHHDAPENRKPDHIV